MEDKLNEGVGLPDEGIELPEEVLELVTGGLSDPVYREALKDFTDMLRNGSTIDFAISAFEALPSVHLPEGFAEALKNLASR